ncbi:MAG: hypothetical protein ABQ298_08315 [Puniceicoccaceae bacterium]
MPYQISWEDRGLRWRFYGKVTSQECVQSNLDIYGDARFDSLRYQIADFSEVTELSLNERDMQKIAYLDKAACRSNPRIKVALVAPSETARELLQAYTHHASDSPWQSQVFSTVEQAEQWLTQTFSFQLR